MFCGETRLFSLSVAHEALWWDMFKTCRSHQFRTVFANLRWGGPYLSNPENSRAVFSPSEILRGLLGAARERPPLARPPPPLAWCLAPRSGCAPPRPRLRPVRGGGRAQTQSDPFPRRDSCFYERVIQRGPARATCAIQIEAVYFCSRDIALRVMDDTSR